MHSHSQDQIVSTTQPAQILATNTADSGPARSIARRSQLDTDGPLWLDLAGQLAPKSQATYKNDIQHFATWLDGQGLTLAALTRSDVIAYRLHLAQSYAKTTAARMLTVARRVLSEAVDRGDLAVNPAQKVKGFKVGDNESPHKALSKKQARAMVGVIDQTTARGKRDYALVLLLIRTGIRRAECAALVLGDIGQEQGHSVITIQHRKGDKRRVVKLPVDVLRAILDYLEASGRRQAGPAAALFVNFRKGDKPTKQRLSTISIGELVKSYAGQVGAEGVTAHGLRASFVTLALEGGAKLEQVQYAAGHADPRTTERYQKRKLNLDDNATDYVRF